MLTTRRMLIAAPPVALGLAYMGFNHARLEELDAPPIAGFTDANGAPVPGVRHADLKGSVTMLHATASWCPYCQQENAFVRTLAGDPRFRLVGLYVKDKEANARAYVARNGNPYVALGFDADGRAERQVGVRGVPNSFVLDTRGRIVHTFRGPLTPEYFNGKMLPVIEAAARSA